MVDVIDSLPLYLAPFPGEDERLLEVVLRISYDLRRKSVHNSIG